MLSKLALTIVVLFSLTLLCLEVEGNKASRDAIRLQDVQVLTFTKGDHTNSRRRSSVPQLKCVGGGAKGEYEPYTAMCRNIGFDGRDVAWKCEADLPVEYSLGKVTVTCEGFDSSKDSYVLKDSCALEYNLEHSEIGKKGTDSTRMYDTVKHGFFASIFYTLGHWIWSIITFPFTVVEWMFSLVYRGSSVLLKTISALAAMFIGVNLFRALSNRGYKQYPKSAGRTPIQQGAVPGGLAGGSTEGRQSGHGFWSGLMGGSLLGYFMTRQRGKDAYQHPDGTRTRVPADIQQIQPIPDTHESVAYGTTKRR